MLPDRDKQGLDSGHGKEDLRMLDTTKIEGVLKYDAPPSRLLIFKANLYLPLEWSDDPIRKANPRSSST